MGLSLLQVAPAQGLAWVRKGLALWAKRPLSFGGLFVFALIGAMLLSVVPVLGGLLIAAALPLMSLGFMAASRSALAGRLVHIGHLVEGLRHPDRARRLSQLQLGLIYAVGTTLVLALADWVDGGKFEQLQMALAQASGSGKHAPDVEAALADPQLQWGMLVRLGLTAALSVPFWHAPALVHWGGQGALQALFSSTLAVWRARGAFVLYLLGWVGAMAAGALLMVLLGLVPGVRALQSVIALAIGLTVSAAYYVSLWFTFADSFGLGSDDAAGTSGSARV